MRTVSLLLVIAAAALAAEASAHADPVRLAPAAFRRPRVGDRVVLQGRAAPTPLPTGPQARYPGVAPQIYRQHLHNTRGIDPNGAVVVVPMGGVTAGRYATQATQARQATQATPARQYRQLRIVRPFGPIPVNLRPGRP